MRYFAKIDESGKVLSVCFLDADNTTEVERLLSLGFVEVTEEEYEKLAQKLLEDRATEPEPEPEPEPSDDLEERVQELEQNSATKADVQAVWDSMAAAYSEGVCEA